VSGIRQILLRVGVKWPGQTRPLHRRIV